MAQFSINTNDGDGYVPEADNTMIAQSTPVRLMSEFSQQQIGPENVVGKGLRKINLKAENDMAPYALAETILKTPARMMKSALEMDLGLMIDENDIRDFNANTSIGDVMENGAELLAYEIIGGAAIKYGSKLFKGSVKAIEKTANDAANKIASNVVKNKLKGTSNNIRGIDFTERIVNAATESYNKNIQDVINIAEKEMRTGYSVYGYPLAAEEKVLYETSKIVEEVSTEKALKRFKENPETALISRDVNSAIPLANNNAANFLNDVRLQSDFLKKLSTEEGRKNVKRMRMEPEYMEEVVKDVNENLKKGMGITDKKYDISVDYEYQPDGIRLKISSDLKGVKEEHGYMVFRENYGTLERDINYPYQKYTLKSGKKPPKSGIPHEVNYAFNEAMKKRDIVVTSNINDSHSNFGLNSWKKAVKSGNAIEFRNNLFVLRNLVPVGIAGSMIYNE